MTWRQPNDKVVVKIDCEGGENFLVRSYLCTEALKTVDYFTMELHFHAANGAKQHEVDMETFRWFGNFRRTHKLYIEKEFLYAIRRTQD
jgi:hypothetical protein